MCCYTVLGRRRFGASGNWIAYCRQSHTVLHVGQAQVAQCSSDADRAGPYNAHSYWFHVVFLLV
jgi:hypothetical protein